MDKNKFNKKIDTILSHLENSKNKIKARTRNINIVNDELADAMDRFRNGKDISGEELQKISESWESKEPLIDENGDPFVLYIPDYTHAFSSYYNNVFPKFHVSWCSKLEYMKESGRQKRYIPKKDIENNLFEGKKGNNEKHTEKLQTCLLCKGKMQSITDGTLYFERDNMDIVRFFELYGKQELGIESEFSNKPYSTKYPRSWRGISLRMREEANWECSKCKGGFSDNRNYLHVHHENGIKSDTSKANLTVLCKKCHTEEPNHSHMKSISAKVGTSFDKVQFSRKTVVETISKSQMNKLENFIKQPERYATGTEKTIQKISDIRHSFEIIKDNLDTEKQEQFLKALQVHESKLRSLRH